MLPRGARVTCYPGRAKQSKAKESKAKQRLDGGRGVTCYPKVGRVMMMLMAIMMMLMVMVMMMMVMMMRTQTFFFLQTAQTFEVQTRRSCAA